MIKSNWFLDISVKTLLQTLEIFAENYLDTVTGHNLGKIVRSIFGEIPGEILENMFDLLLAFCKIFDKTTRAMLIHDNDKMSIETEEIHEKPIKKKISWKKLGEKIWSRGIPIGIPGNNPAGIR